ncbi:site-specific integrase [Streptomyces sp. NPDC046881]|uniref:site-specific integrase n=1 Tax=Streptomyces sp. NPDC046881 TaxID=3155374 RepID=UPI0033E6473B
MEDLVDREDRLGLHPGDPIMLSPDYRIDELLSLCLCRSGFARLEPGTRRNYADDYRLFFDFLWDRGKVWNQATDEDVADFEYWRTRAGANPGKVGGSRWNRGLAALTRLYQWAERREYIGRSPVLMRDFIGRTGELIRVPQARAKEALVGALHQVLMGSRRLRLQAAERPDNPHVLPSQSRPPARRETQERTHRR